MPVVPTTWEAERGIICTHETEVAVSQDHATALQPGDRARLHLKNKKKLKKREREENIWYVIWYSTTADVAIPNFPKELSYTQVKKKTLLTPGYLMWRQKV